METKLHFSCTVKIIKAIKMISLKIRWQLIFHVLLFKGLECSAADFVIGDTGASLAYLLADNGYDVWLGNGRGNIFSKAHETLNTTSYDFWNFSFHEIGVYDVPAMIDYALNMNNATKLTYIGYSQGTTVFLILLSMKPDYNSKISIAYLMAPAVYFRYATSFLTRLSSMVHLFSVISLNFLFLGKLIIIFSRNLFKLREYMKSIL